MMTKENIRFSEETQKFNHAVDLFFGMRPERRLWILLMLYLGKEKSLRVIDNTSPEDYGNENSYQNINWHVMASLSYDDINSKEVREEWSKKGITRRFILADTPADLDCSFDELVYSLDVDSHNMRQAEDSNQSIFNSHRWESTYLMEIAIIFMSLSDEWYKEKASWAFDYIVERFLYIFGKEFGMYVQPKEITNIVGTLLNATEGTVYNPYAGICSYTMAIGENCHYYGQEFSSIAAIIGKLNLLIKGKKNAVIQRCIPDAHWGGENDCFDYVVSTPPFGMHIPRQQSQYKTAHDYYLSNSALIAKKKAIGVYPTSACFNSRADSNYKPIIDIVKNDWLDTVILLPKNIFSYTSIPTVIILINKNKSTPNRVKMVDASDCFVREHSQRPILDFNCIVETINGSNAIMVDNYDILTNDGIIYPPYYLNTDVSLSEKNSCVRLSDIISLSNGTLNQSLDSDRIFTFPNNKYGKPILEVDARLLSNENRKTKQTYAVVAEDCLIVSRRFKFQAVYLHTNGMRVAVSPSYDIYLIDKSKVIPSYLVNELAKDYFLSQLKRFGEISYLSQIRREDFLSLLIHIPDSLEAQLASSVSETEKALSNLRIELEKVYAEKTDSFVKTQRQRKHALQQVLGEIKPAVENITDFVHEKGKVRLTDIISQRSGRTFDDYLGNIRTQLERAIKMVDSFTATDQFGQAENIELVQFISDYCDHKLSDRIVFPRKDNKEKESLLANKESFFVSIAPVDLKVVFDNLITNAEKYGFIDSGRKDYEIQFSLEQRNDKIVVHIANNGVPVSYSIPLSKLFTWGVGQGTGTGCSQAKEILEHFGAQIDYQEFLDDEYGFSCDFQIVLPLIDYIEND